MATEKTAISKVNNLEGLAKAIQQTNQLFLNQVQKQVNTSLTLRNWVIGHHIFEYEQKGEDRAQYGERLYRKLVERLPDTPTNEMQEGDTHPIGIILCAGKNETLVKYATAGLPQKVFVSKYLINLPSEKQLKEIIEEEQGRIQ